MDDSRGVAKLEQIWKNKKIKNLKIKNNKNKNNNKTKIIFKLSY